MRLSLEQRLIVLLQFMLSTLKVAKSLPSKQFEVLQNMLEVGFPQFGNEKISVFLEAALSVYGP